MANPAYETPNGLLAAAQECGYDRSAFRQVAGRRALALIDSVLEAFTVRGVANRSRIWLWEDFRQPSLSVSAHHDLEDLRALAAPETRVWLLVEDWAGEKRATPFWIFDASLAAAIGTLKNHHGLEFYIASRSFEWLVAENHHGMLIGVGDHAVRVLRSLGSQ